MIMMMTKTSKIEVSIIHFDLRSHQKKRSRYIDGKYLLRSWYDPNKARYDNLIFCSEDISPVKVWSLVILSALCHQKAMELWPCGSIVFTRAVTHSYDQLQNICSIDSHPKTIQSMIKRVRSMCKWFKILWCLSLCSHQITLQPMKCKYHLYDLGK